MRVPFNRVMIKKTPVETTEHVDIAGVSLTVYTVSYVHTPVGTEYHVALVIQVPELHTDIMQYSRKSLKLRLPICMCMCCHTSFMERYSRWPVGE